MSEAEATGKTVSRAEHHADSDVPKVRRAKDRIAWILRRRDCREHAISSKALARATGWKPGEPSDGIKPTTVRDCIKEIRAERDLPIESCGRGYYLIGTVSELERYIENRKEEKRTIDETIQEQVQAFNAMRYGGES